MGIIRDSLRRAFAILSISLMAQLAQAATDGLQDVAKLIRQGQHAQALGQVDRFLAGNPKDAQGRFLKGVILTEMKRTPEAIAIFTRLTEDFPELPEPYNNLAVIYAQQKNYDKARQALEMAIRTHPSYATAHENLGDIYARMASQAYDKALQLDNTNATAQTKLAMIRDLMSVSPRGGRAATPTPATPPAPPVVVAEAPKPPSAAPPVPAETRHPATTATPTVPVEPPAPAPAAAAQDDIARTVNAWAGAWASKNVKTYLSFYAPGFKPPGGMSRTAWEAERRQRVSKAGRIQVDIENLTVRSEAADRAVAKFRQHYRSATFKSSSGKLLVLVRVNGKWLIEQERVGG